MDIKQTVSEAVEKVQEAVGLKEEEQVSSDPVETPVEETKQEAVDQPVEETVDRSAYNCPDCKGEGLIRELDKVCTTCNGTGKV